MISVFGGTGFIGSTFCKIYSDKTIVVQREDRNFSTSEVLYFISTTTNHNIFDDLHVDIDTNLKILVDVLYNCIGKDITFNFISSGFVYGTDILNAKEDDNCNPRGFYSITKHCAEQLLITFAETFNIKYRIIRIGNVYGQDKTVSSKKNVLGYIVNLLKNNQDVHLYNGGRYLKDYIHVNDVCKAINLILQKGSLNQIYNVASGDQKYFIDIVDRTKKILGSKSNIIDTSIENKGHFFTSKNMTLNIDKLKQLGFVCDIDIWDGLQTICDRLK